VSDPRAQRPREPHERRRFSAPPGYACRLAFLVMVGVDTPAPSRTLRLAELLASVSLATDLGTGQPLGHALRTCTIATVLAEAMGCGRDEVRTVHQFALLRFLGCTSDAAETAAVVGGDERAYNAAMGPVLMGSGREMLGRHVRSVAPGQPRMRRLRLVARGLADPKAGERSLSTHCEVAAMLAGRVGLEQPVIDALAHAYERWDGTGYPDRLRGDEIPLSAQIVGIVDVYDALTTDRPYRPGFSTEQALAEITRCRGWWSERVFAAFLGTLADLPATAGLTTERSAA